MRGRSASVALVALVMVSQSFLFIEYGGLEDVADRHEVDYGGPIAYTDEHTFATVGEPGRYTLLRMPGGHDYSRPLPLVVALHGYSGSGNGNAEYMHLFDSVHENEHLLLYPDGTSNLLFMRYWNATDACCEFVGSSVDDVNYLLGLIDEAVQSYGADPDGIIITGLSNGGFMSHRMACDAGDSIRAIVALNGVTWDDFDECSDTGRPDILHVHSTSDTVIWYEGGSITGNSYPSANETVQSWADRSGCDSEWTFLGSRDISGDDGSDETDEFEFMNCSSGNRVSHWRINGGSHVPPLNDMGWADQTLDWALSGFIRDSDGDGHRDDIDAFVYDTDEWADEDGDGVGDNSDAFPADPSEWADFDGDGVGDNADVDDDNDGWNDGEDAFPNDGFEWNDTDGDGTGDNADLDDDGDGYLDVDDAFSLDPTEWADFDGDGVGDNADLDDDGDGWTDSDELSCGSDPWDSESSPDDFDGDWSCDPVDDDDDGDGVWDVEDIFPMDPNEWADIDEDGVGDNSDEFPTDDEEWLDTDGDGVGDNSDAFPENQWEWDDTDGDGVGDNSDAFPDRDSEWQDTDGDGYGENEDAFPLDLSEWNDTDGDGVGDNSDFYPLDASRSEEEWPVAALLLIAVISGAAYIYSRSSKGLREL